jgi:hypothetical protein
MRRYSLAFLLSVLPSAAYAFCGFYVGGASGKLYNNATQVVLMRDGTRTVLAMQNNYQGPPENFAMVIPVPVVLQKENVKTLTKDILERIDVLDSPRLVEYWEQDPCARNDRYEMLMSPPPQMAAEAKADAKPAGDFGVKIEAQFNVAEYEIVILTAENSTGLDGWLKQEKYNIPEGAAPVLKPYIESGMKFFVAKVDPTKVTFKDGQAMLSPLRFHYDSESFALPIRLGMLNAKDKQDLIVHILSKDRFEVTNYTNVFIPTNLEVSEKTKDDFGSFYATLFDATLEKFKDADGRNPVVTEYSWVSGSCDPCPGPALDPGDILTLGGDVLPSFASDVQSGNIWGLTQLTLTRLHARYDQSTLGEDLVFRTATPKEGGRETGYGDQKNYTNAMDSSSNNFQGRYIIRHPWTGPITCIDPTRGVWGGPPGDRYGSNQPMAAKDLAFAKRGTVTLGDTLMVDVPAIGFTVPKPFFQSALFNLILSIMGGAVMLALLFVMFRSQKPAAKK